MIFRLKPFYFYFAIIWLQFLQLISNNISTWYLSALLNQQLVSDWGDRHEKLKIIKTVLKFLFFAPIEICDLIRNRP